MDLNLTLFIEMVIFVIFILLTMHYVWPPFQDILEKRKIIIENGLKNAEKAEKSLLKAEEDAKNIINESRRKAKEDLEKAQIENKGLFREAEHEIQKLKKRKEKEYKEEINSMLSEAKKHINKEISNTAISICKKVLQEKKLSEKIQSDIIKKALEESQ